MSNGSLIGQILVKAGTISEAQLGAALERQSKDPRRLGEILVEGGDVTEAQLVQALAGQLAVPWVSLQHVDFTPELIARLPLEVCERLGAVPVYVRKVRQQGDTLFVAMDDPTNAGALAEISTAVGLPVKAMLATPSELRAAIKLHYRGERPEPKKPPPPPPRPQPGKGTDAKWPVPERPSTVMETAAATTAAEKPAPERRASKPPAAKGKGKGRTITLLDGTTVSLPAPAPGEADDSLAAGTVAEIVDALRSLSDGKKPARTIRAEAVIAAVLHILARKHLVTEAELAEELGLE